MVTIKKHNDKAAFLLYLILPVVLLFNNCIDTESLEESLGIKKKKPDKNSELTLLYGLWQRSGTDDGQGNATFPDDVMAPWEGGSSYYAEWNHGPSSDPNFFPVAVWLQSPNNADAYKAIGINTFVGLWKGPTPDQLSQLVDDQMPVFCDQNDTGLNNDNNTIIKGWTHLDEPDNAQSAPGGGWGDPVLPSEIVSRYLDMVENDPTRPVFLNFGQGVAWDGWYGRGDRTGFPEDYAEYSEGADIVSFDIYPVNSDHTDVSGKLWLVAFGVDRLREWCDYSKAVWNWIECTWIDADSGRKPTPREVKAEVWMSLIHGSMGIGYFAHCINPFDEPGLLHDAEMKNAVSAINRQIAELALVLNSPTVANGAAVTSSNPTVPVDFMLKRLGDYTYLFAVSMRSGATNAVFTLRSFPPQATAEALGENRTLNISNGVLNDSFSDFSVHLYRIGFQ